MDCSTADRARTSPDSEESMATKTRRAAERNVLRGLVQRPLDSWPYASALRVADFRHFQREFESVSWMIRSFLEDNKRPIFTEEILSHPESGFGPEILLEVFESFHPSVFGDGVFTVLGRNLTNGEFARIGRVANHCERIAERECGLPVEEKRTLNRKSVWDAIRSPQPLAEVVIDGLVRRGEVMNIISSTKVGKSWLVGGLMFCVSKGLPWLGRKTKKGNVLLIDNELQPSVIENRMAVIADSMRIKHATADAKFDYWSLRGLQKTIHEIVADLEDIKPGELTMLVLDAKYRFFGSGMEENSNDDQTAFHNTVDRLASRLQCVVVLVHHSTKGEQGGRNVTDVGSGGGAQSRAADTHLVIRQHADDGLAVLDAAVRSFPPVEPQTLKWEFPLWTATDGVDAVLKQEKSRNDSRQECKDKQALSELADIFHAANGKPQTRWDLHRKFGGGKDRLNRLIRLGIDDGRFLQIEGKPTRNGEVAEQFMLSAFVQNDEQKSNGLF